MAKLTYDRVDLTSANAVNAAKLLVSQADTRTIQQALLEAGSGSAAGNLNFEFREITALEAAAQEMSLVLAPSSPSNTVVFVSGGTVQFYGEDYIVVGDVLSWSGKGLADIIVEGTKLIILYPYATGVIAGSGDVTRVQYATLSSAEIAQKYIDLISTPTNPTTVQVFLIGGSAQVKDTDWELITDGVSVKRLSWDGLGLDGQVVENDQLMIVYTISTSGVDEAINVQVDTSGFSGNLSSLDTDVQAALNTIDGLLLGGGSGTGILGSGSIMLVDPNHPSAADDGNVITPFVTIQAAINAATPAVSSNILIADGTYTENLIVADNRHIKLTALSGSKSTQIPVVILAGIIQVGKDPTLTPFTNVSGSLFLDGIKVNTGLVYSAIYVHPPSGTITYNNSLVLNNCHVTGTCSNALTIDGGLSLGGVVKNTIEIFNSTLGGSTFSVQIYNDVFCQIENSTFDKAEVTFTSAAGYFYTLNSDFSKLITIESFGTYKIYNCRIIRPSSPLIECAHNAGTISLELVNNYLLSTNIDGNWLVKATGDVNLSRFVNNSFYNFAENIPVEVSPVYENGKEILIRQYEGIDALSTGTFNLYTVPIATKVVITKAIFRLTSISGIAGTLACGIGVAAGDDDIITSTALTGFNTTSEIYKIETSGNYKIASAGEIIKLGIDTAFTGTTATLSVDLFGYLVV